MAELVIRLVVDPETGKREIVVDYRSDPDALPIEHEQEHRRLVEQLVEGGVSRRAPAVPAAGGAETETPIPEGEKQRS